MKTSTQRLVLGFVLGGALALVAAANAQDETPKLHQNELQVLQSAVLADLQSKRSAELAQLRAELAAAKLARVKADLEKPGFTLDERTGKYMPQVPK
jgi:hypothetical protein